MLSGCQGWQADGGIIAQRCDGFQADVACALDRPFVVLLQQEGADQAEHCLFVGEYPDDIAAALDLAVEAFERIGNWYEIIGAEVPTLISGSRCMLRASGTEAPGARRCGQAVPYDEL